MPQKPLPTAKKAKKARTRKAVSRLTDDGFLLVFTDVVARVAILSYANLIGRVNPQLSQELTRAVEAAGGWGDSELGAAINPEHEHKWVDASNKAVASGQVCVTCGTARASEEESDASEE